VKYYSVVNGKTAGNGLREVYSKLLMTVYLLCDLWNDTEDLGDYEFIVESYEVIPESVGQYTRMKDKRGKRFLKVTL